MFVVFIMWFGDFKFCEYNLFVILIIEMVFECYVGGYIYDCGVDGSVCKWVCVLVYELFSWVLFMWDIGLIWWLEIDLVKISEVEVCFIV